MEAGLKISILGSGNVATHLALALSASGHEIAEIYSRDLSHARRLAERIGCGAIDSLESLSSDSAVYLIAVSDDAVAEIMNLLPNGLGDEGIWCHTAGSVGLSALESRRKRGVFYPLQTFSRTVDVDVRAVPFIIEGSDEWVASRLESLARSISDEVTRGDSSRRRTIHVAAVFACNFPMYLWSVSERLLNDAGLDMSLLHPLMRVTLDKAMNNHPKDVMTGPARRGDISVIADHLRSLEGTDMRLYKMLSDEIIAAYAPGKKE
ncbi:MAG: DUF2520 domain-containing protein [Muribaculaceae bacterium]|nr:DUF2520 domain-containing protein [Muribaculaceae bacterium]